MEESEKSLASLAMIALAILDFIHEAGKLLPKMKLLPYKLKETNTTKMEAAKYLHFFLPRYAKKFFYK